MSKKIARAITDPKQQIDTIQSKIKNLFLKTIFKPIINNFQYIKSSSVFDVNIYTSLMQTLDEVDKNKKEYNFEKDAQDINNNLDRQWQSKIGLEPSMNEKNVKMLNELYTENMNLYIKDFTEEQTLKMRQDLTELLSQGKSVKDVQDYIAERYDVSKSKAKFLARNETQQYMQAYQRSQSEEAGIDKAIWQTANDNRVRPDHKELDNMVYSIKDGVVDKKTGQKIWPGSDYNCRCQARLIIEW